ENQTLYARYAFELSYANAEADMLFHRLSHILIPRIQRKATVFNQTAKSMGTDLRGATTLLAYNLANASDSDDSDEKDINKRVIRLHKKQMKEKKGLFSRIGYNADMIQQNNKQYII